VRLVTDQNADVIARHDYLPFGEEIPGNIAGRNGLWGPERDTVNQKFTGKQRDQESGLDYFGARYYGSALGRFTSPDPLDANIIRILNPQRWNKYAYVVNNPLALTDPDGRDAVAVNFSGMVAGLGHEGILSVHADGSATYARFGPATQDFRGGYGVDEPGRVDTQDPTDLPNVQFDSNGVPTTASFDALKAAVARAEGVGANTVRLNYFKTSEADTNALDLWIKQQQGTPGRYHLCSRNCGTFTVRGLVAGGAITTSQAAGLSIDPNILFRQLAAFSNLNQPSGQKEQVTSKVCFTDSQGKQVCQ
jgi:RHS repeat-associated protein